MTLIITEVSQFGIAMVADSAVTYIMPTPSGGQMTRVLNGVVKLQTIPCLNAGISMWGAGALPTIHGLVDTDIWIYDFIQNHAHLTSVREFAETLSEELKRCSQAVKLEPVGFHVAGYADYGGGLAPTVYHVRNCDGNFIDGYSLHEFIPGLHYPLPDRSVDDFMIDLKRQKVYYLRNGDYGAYALLVQAVQDRLGDIAKSSGLVIPQPSLEGRCDYLRSWIDFVSDLYASANRQRTIGGNVACLGISPDGSTILYRI